MKPNIQVPFIVLLFISFISRAQLVNIESQRMQTDSTRFVLKSDWLLNYNDNNGDYVLQATANISTQFKSKDLNKIYFLVANYSLVRTGERDFWNSWFLHGRYNHQISEFFRFEAFVQNQNNTQLTIRRRNLIGTGLRFKLIGKERTRAYLGNSYMYEIERLSSSDRRFYNHRHNSYLSLNHSFEKINLYLTGTIYFQPLYKDIGNHRILCQIKAELPLTKNLSLSSVYDYFYTRFSSDLENDRSSYINLGLSINLE